MDDITNITQALNSQLSQSFLKALPPELLAKFSFIFDLLKVLLIVFIVYFIIVLITKLLALRDSFNIKSIAKNTQETNEKLARLIDLLSPTQNSSKKKVKGKDKDKSDKEEIKINHFP